MEPQLRGASTLSRRRFVQTGSEFGFSFRSDPGASTARGFADLGRERNGAFL